MPLPPSDNARTRPPQLVDTPQPRVEPNAATPKAATTTPDDVPARTDTTPPPIDAILNMQPPELPDLPSSRTRSRTAAAITSIGAALVATGLRDTSADTVVILSGDGPEPRRRPAAARPKDAP